MGLVESFMQPGQFTIPLKEEVDLFRVWEHIREFGTVVVLPQWCPHPVEHSDASLLLQARYRGVVLRPSWQTGNIHIWGQGLWWYLGDAFGRGPMIDTFQSFTAATMSTVITALLPSAVAAGTLTNTDLATYDGDHINETCSSAIRTVLKDLGAHARINPNLTFDACKTTRDEVYRITAPQVVAVRQGWGHDPNYRGIEAIRVETVRDASNWVDTAVVVDVDSEGASAVTATETTVHTYYDGRGNALTRTAQVMRPAADLVDPAGYLTNELAELTVADEQTVDTSQWEFTGGSLNVGDNFFVFDPPSGFIDESASIRFRGEVIWPKKVRCLEASVPLTVGMGVYYRPSGAAITSADWIDMTRWIQWEATP